MSSLFSNLETLLAFSFSQKFPPEVQEVHQVFQSVYEQIASVGLHERGVHGEYSNGYFLREDTSYVVARKFFSDSQYLIKIDFIKRIKVNRYMGLAFCFKIQNNKVRLETTTTRIPNTDGGLVFDTFEPMKDYHMPGKTEFMNKFWDYVQNFHTIDPQKIINSELV